MSSKNFKVLHSKSIYNNLEFHQEPYSSTQKFKVFIPKESDYVNQMIEKDITLSKSKSFFNFNARTSSAPILQDLDKLEQDDSYKFVGKLNTQYETPIKHELDLVQPQTTKANVLTKFDLPLQLKPILKTFVSPKSNYSVKTFRATTTVKQVTRNKQLKQLRESLYFDELTKSIPKSTIKNHIIEDIVQDGEIFLQRQDLLQSIHKLKQLKLLKNHDTNVNRFPGIGKVSFVFNDYHTKSTNNGYSRNFGGVFFTR